VYDNPNNKDTHGKIRKLSVTCSLSDPKDYKGGELEFDFRNMGPDKPTIRKCAEIAARGSIVVFPSHVWHRVKPVTKGTRYSLVIWNLGYPFR
jgi:PKHD-type hydroxylase